MADLVSILIPTRNRPLLARLCVETALENSDEDCEIVVADNGDEPLELTRHPRLRVLPPPPQPLAMPDNWERALDASRGQWVMLLSDKYMLVRDGLAALRRETMGGDRLVYYVYGVLRQRLDAQDAGSAQKLSVSGGELTWAIPAAPHVASSHATLERMAANAGEYPAWAPMLYTALAHRSLVARSKLPGTTFFFGPCPDIASSLRLLSATESYRVTRIPAIMAQYPSQSAEWSTGSSTQLGGAAGRGFIEQLAQDGAKAPAGLEALVSVLMHRTLLEGSARLPDLRNLRPSWRSLAAHGAREIEGLPATSRWKLHFRLARFVARGARTSGPLWAQICAASGVRAPRTLLRIYRRLVAPAAEQPGADGQVVCASVRSRQEALEHLGDLARFAPESAPGPSVDVARSARGSAA